MPTKDVQIISRAKMNCAPISCLNRNNNMLIVLFECYSKYMKVKKLIQLVLKRKVKYNTTKKCTTKLNGNN